MTHKDILLRFGSELFFSLCEIFGCEVVIINKSENSTFEEDLAQVAKLHYKIACIREDALHKLTTYLPKNHSQIVCVSFM